MGRPFTPSVISIELFKTKGPTVILKLFILTLLFLGEKRAIDVSVGAIHLGFPHIFTDFSRWMLQQRCIGRLFNGGNPSIYSRSCQTTALVRSVGAWAEMGDDSKVRIFPIFPPEKQGKHMVLHSYSVILSWNQRAMCFLFGVHFLARYEITFHRT